MNGGFLMDIKEIFAKMNQKLEKMNIQVEQPFYNENDIHKEVEVLKNQSETIVDEWLKFEEKLGFFLKKTKEKKTNSSSVPDFSQEHYEASYKKLLQLDHEGDPNTQLGNSSTTTTNEPQSEWWRKGKALYDLNMYDQSVQFLQKVLEEEPEFEPACFYVAHSYLELNQYDKARYYWQFLADTSDNQRMKLLALHALACLEATLEKYERALVFFRKINLKDVDSLWKPTIVFNYAQALYHTSQLEECLDQLMCYYELEPQDWKGPYLIGKVYHQQGNEEVGFAFWFEALQLQQSKDLLKKMARHFEEKTYYQMAAQCYERCLKEETLSSDEEIWFGLAWNYGLANQKEKSRSAYLKGLSIFPDHLQLQLSYVWMLFFWGDDDEANRRLQRLQVKYVDHPMVEGLHHLSVGEYEHALSVLHEASEQL